MELRYTQKDLAQRLSVDPGSIYKYENEKMTPGLKVLDKIYKLCEEESLNEPIKLINNFDLTKKEENDMDARYLIQLQRDKITYQEERISYLEEQIKQKQGESTHWDSLTYDYILYVSLIRNGVKFGRRFDRVSDLEKQSSILGYSVKELEKLYDINTDYEQISDHPIDKIICSKTRKYIAEQTKTLPTIFDAMKSMVGNHYIPHPLVYIHKDGSKVGAIAYCKVEWLKMKVVSKVQYIID